MNNVVKLGIIILNYNTWEESIQCIKSIEKYTNIPYKIYLIDNKSKINASEEQLSIISDFKHTELIYSNENRGYSAGNNIGIKKALEECQYIMICNSDILFVDNSIEKMIEFLEKNKNVGIIGPTIYNTENILQPFYMITKLTAIGKIKNMLLKTPLKGFLKKFKENFIIDKEIEEPKKVFGVSGCCFLMSKECARFLYPLDERVFLYEEEYIIGVRLENQYDVYIFPNTHIIHAHGKSTGGMTEFSYNCLIESEQLYLKEYLHTNIFLRKIILFIRKVLKKHTVKG